MSVKWILRAAHFKVSDSFRMIDLNSVHFMECLLGGLGSFFVVVRFGSLSNSSIASPEPINVLSVPAARGQNQFTGYG